MKRTFVALLRGINVGKAKRVAMADLRRLFEGMGYAEVRTLLNSGNVVFSASRGEPGAIGAKVEKEMEKRLGVSARVTVVSAEELAAVVAGNPHAKVATNPSRHLVAFFADAETEARVAPLLRKRWHPEAAAAGPRVAYLWCPESILESPLFAEVAKVAKDGATTRNWATVEKLHALAAR